MILPTQSLELGTFQSLPAQLEPSSQPGIPAGCNDLKELSTVEAVPFALRVLWSKTREHLGKNRELMLNMLNQQMSRQITSNYEPESGSRIKCR